MASEKFDTSHFVNLKCAGTDVVIALIVRIHNSGEVKKGLIEGSIPAALINSEIVVDIWQVKVAVYKALINKERDKITTKNIFSEIIFNLHPTRQVMENSLQSVLETAVTVQLRITEAFRKCGMTELSTECVAITVGENALADMITVVKNMPHAQVLPFNEKITSYRDENRIKNLYKITDAQLLLGTLSDAVVMKMAAKDCL